MRHQVLLVQENEDVYEMVQTAVTESHKLTWVKNIEEAQKELAETDFELVLLDIDLPDGSGINLCQSISSSNPEIAIFILTDSDDLSDKVLGFTAGADDYISRPFETLELKLRIEAKLKKMEWLKMVHNELEWDEIIINKSKQLVQIQDKEEFKEVDLTALEFKILMYFANRPDRVISRDQMLDDIWGTDVHVYSRSIDTHVSKLRKKLEQVSNIIESVHGVGYKFTPTSTTSV